MAHDSTGNFCRHLSARWCVPATVESFRTNPPNQVLLEYARRFREQHAVSDKPLRALDIGGGAGRNAVPLAQLGFHVVCTDLSFPMLQAALTRRQQVTKGSLHLVQSPMAPLPFRDEQFDLIVAHGIWNLARSGAEFRSAVREAARVARPGAGLFLFTFSRHTIPDGALPVAGEQFVFTQFNGEPHCFLTNAEIVHELEKAQFLRDSPEPLTEYNFLPSSTAVQRPPVIYEGTFRRGA